MKLEHNWQPISNLPLIASMIDGQLETAQEQYDSLSEVRSKLHVLDDNAVNRVSDPTRSSLNLRRSTKSNSKSGNKKRVYHLFNEVNCNSCKSK